MTCKLISLTALGILLAGGILGQSKGGDSDPPCLEGFVVRYMDALIAHAHTLLPGAAQMKRTETGERLRPGHGFWLPATGTRSPTCSSRGLRRTTERETIPSTTTAIASRTACRPPIIRTIVLLRRRERDGGRRASRLRRLRHPSPR